MFCSSDGIGTSHSISRGVEYLNLESGVTVVVLRDRIRAARRFSFSAASPEIQEIKATIQIQALQLHKHNTIHRHLKNFVVMKLLNCSTNKAVDGYHPIENDNKSRLREQRMILEEKRVCLREMNTRRLEAILDLLDTRTKARAMLKQKRTDKLPG